jgi:hypothetical protein
MNDPSELLAALGLSADVDVTDSPDLVDPDPFTIGLGIFAAVAGGGAFLEARRQRQIVESQQKGAFRSAWFAARRTLIHFKQNLDEFETFVLEDGYGTRKFRIGAVRLTVDAGRHKALRRLRGQCLTTAHHMGDDLDELSEFLGGDYAERIQLVLEHLAAIGIPETYGELIKAARNAFYEYESLLTYIADVEGFELHAPDGG